MRALDVSVRKVRLVQVCPHEAGMIEDGLGKADRSLLGWAEIRPLETGAGEVLLVESRAAEFSACEVRRTQRSRRVGSEIVVGEVLPAEVFSGRRRALRILGGRGHRYAAGDSAHNGRRP